MIVSQLDGSTKNGYDRRFQMPAKVVLGSHLELLATN